MVTSFATPAIDWIARSRAVRHVEGFRLEPHPEAFYEEEQIPNELRGGALSPREGRLESLSNVDGVQVATRRKSHTPGPPAVRTVLTTVVTTARIHVCVRSAASRPDCPWSN